MDYDFHFSSFWSEETFLFAVNIEYLLFSAGLVERSKTMTYQRYKSILSCKKSLKTIQRLCRNPFNNNTANNNNCAIAFRRSYTHYVRTTIPVYCSHSSRTVINFCKYHSEKSTVSCIKYIPF